MYCSDCRYSKFSLAEYPCSVCDVSKNMYVEDDGNPVSKETLLLISELRELKTLVQRLIEER